MSPFGHEDYGISQEREIVHAVTDLGELATRLGSPNAYNRSGNVVVMDTFEDGIAKWAWYVSPGSGSFTLSQESAKNGAFSGRLYSPATYPNAVEILRGVGILPIGALGLEFSYSTENAVVALEAYILVYLNNRLNKAGVRIDWAQGKIFVLNSANTWQEVTTTTLAYVGNYIFNTAKLVVDFEGALYRRLLVNSDEWIISNLPYYSYAYTSYPHVRMNFFARTTQAQAIAVYLDDIILTQNEV